jgi:cyclase
VVVSVDVRRTGPGAYRIYVRGGQDEHPNDVVAYVREMGALGAGEILLTAIDRDGTQLGYDLDLIRCVTEAVSVPVVAVGGAGSLQHLRDAVSHGASAVAAGSMFVFHGKHRAVLITYPDYQTLVRLFES